MALYFVLGATPLAALGAYWWWRKRPAPEQPLLAQLFRCPRCSQMMRYPLGQAGRAIACPVCWKRVTLPSAA